MCALVLRHLLDATLSCYRACSAGQLHSSRVTYPLRGVPCWLSASSSVDRHCAAVDQILLHNVHVSNPPPTTDEAAEVLVKESFTPGAAAPPKGQIPCYDPSTMQLLGHTKAMTPAEVRGEGR